MRNVVETVGQLALGQQQLASKVDQLGQPTIHDTTPAALGERTLAALEARGAVYDFESNIPPKKGSAVPDNRHQQPALDSEQQQALMNCKSEAEVVEVLTPVLWHLLIADINADACDVVLVSKTLLFWKRKMYVFFFIVCIKLPRPVTISGHTVLCPPTATVSLTHLAAWHTTIAGEQRDHPMARQPQHAVEY
jgi:hypothetical protein